MAIRYKIKVINSPSGTPIKSIPSMSASSAGIIANGTELIIDNVKTAMDKSVWFRIEGTSNWILYQNGGAISAKLMKNMSDGNSQASDEKGSSGGTETKYTDPKLETGNASSTTSGDANSVSNSGTYGISVDIEEDGEARGYVVIGLHSKDTLQQNSAAYPPKTGEDGNGEFVYDYTINTNFIKDTIKKIKINMNIPSAFTRDEVNVLMNSSFNRYDIVYPDYLSYGLKGVVFFTRPDLWLLDDEGNFLDQVTNDPQLYYISKTNDRILKQLTLSYSASHEFIPLLCNTCESLDVSDESVEVFENIGETWTGNKMQYARHTIRSMVAGTFNCKFRETYDLGVTHMMQGWCNYESSVYLGTMLPKTEYIGDKILDYACDAYMFLLDRHNTIKFLTKYYGVFPVSVNKSVYSYDNSSPIHLPEQNITFAYMMKKDLSPEIIVEFNKHSKLPYNYKLDYEKSSDEYSAYADTTWSGYSGTTWSGPPFIETITVPNGTASKSDILKLRYRPRTISNTSSTGGTTK